jgi:hypothetical protein
MVEPSRLRPLIDFEREIRELAQRGQRKLTVPDLGLYIGASVDEGSRRIRALMKYAESIGVDLYIRNERNGDEHVRPFEPEPAA